MKRTDSLARQLTVSALCLTLCLVLPFLTGQIKQIGNALCPMHLPVFLCAYLCGAPWAAAVGFVAPLLRFALFQMPPVFPFGISMAFELACYGLVSGLLYQVLPGRMVRLYGSLLAAMAAGRIVWGTIRFLLAGLSGSEFSMAMFWAGAIFNAVPGILIQLILVPAIVLGLERAKLTALPQ